MATGDGQVVFTVELDDTAFQAGMARLNAALAGIGTAVYAALALGAAQLAEAYAAGGQWAGRMAAGIVGSRSVAAAVKTAATAAATAATATARTGGTGVGRSMVDGMASGAASRSGVLATAIARVVEQALAAARRAAGIASPSRLFRDEVGQYLALGVQSGFEDTMAASVVPAIGAGVGRMAQAGRRALAGTVLAVAQSALGAQLSLPTLPQISAAALRGAAVAMPTGAAAARPGDSVVNMTQNITFETAMQAPDEIARAVRRQATWGLANARAQG